MVRLRAYRISGDGGEKGHTLAWGFGGRLKAPPMPFGYFRAVESNSKTRICQSVQVALKRKNQEKYNPSGVFDPTSLCTREAPARCPLVTFGQSKATKNAIPADGVFYGSYARTRASPTFLVRRRLSKCSSRATAYLREVPRASRNSARVIWPFLSMRL